MKYFIFVMLLLTSCERHDNDDRFLRTFWMDLDDKKLFEIADTDSNGSVTREELLNARRNWAKQNNLIIDERYSHLYWGLRDKDGKRLTEQQAANIAGLE